MQEINPLTQSMEKAEENKQFLIPTVEKAYDKYFKKVTELKKGDVITSPHCKLCNHPVRAEAEAKWEQTKGGTNRGSYTLVIKLLNDHPDFEKNGGVKFNYQNVSVHLNHHYEQQVKRMWLREYGTHLAEIMNYKVAKDQMFEAMIQASQLKMFEAAANPDLDPGKQADIMAKLSKAVLDVSMVQAKLRGEVDTIDLYKEKFQKIIVNFISTENDSTRQRELIEKLDMAKQELSG